MAIVKNSAFSIDVVDCGYLEKDLITPKIIYKYFSVPTDNGELKKRIQQLTSDRLWFSYKYSLNDPMDLMLMNTEGLSEELKQYYLDTTKNKVLACFTDSDVNTLMWAHYASSFIGFCVGFDISKINKSIAGVKKVEYVDDWLYLKNEYEKFHELKDAGVLQEACMDWIGCIKQFELLNTVDSLSPIFYAKLKQWGYENEYRIVFNHNSKCIAEKYDKGCLIDTEQLGICISSVTYGLKCPAIIRELFEEYRTKRMEQGNNIDIRQLKYHGINLVTEKC